MALALVLAKRKTGNRIRSRAADAGVHAVLPNPESRPSTDECPVVPIPGRSRRRAAGFTLLEMLAVIVLIGVIGAVVVTQVGKNVDKGKYGAGKAQLITLSQKIDNYALDNGTPPQQLQDLATRPANAPNWQGPYAKESELKDPWGHAFGYKYPGDHVNYDLIFYGQDGQPGGDGYSKDVGNWQ
jgi:general secretion pathway protein G